MSCACFTGKWILSEFPSVAAQVLPGVISSFPREFSSLAALPVSHLPWPVCTAKPRLGLELITHSFNRKCLHFQLSVGGWRADKL